MNWNFWRRPFNSYVFLWMALGLLTLTILLVIGGNNSRERSRWVNHTLQILQETELYEASILAVQYGTKVEAGTKPPEGSVDADVERAKASIERLLVLAADNLRESVRLRVLQSLTAKAAQRIRAQRAAPAMLGLPIQNIWADLPINDTLAEIRKEERTLLEQREQERSSADEIFFVFTAVALCCNLLIVGWAYSNSRRYVRERNQTEHEVRDLNMRLGEQVAAFRDLNQTLENRISDKTSELEAVVTKLKASNQELERFAYIASHDMQEPLRQVASFNNLLAMKYSDKLDETGLRYLQYSVAGAKRLQLMLRGLLQYTITTSGSVYRVEIQVASLMAWVLRELAVEIEQSKAIIQLVAADSLAVVGDVEMMRTLLLALVSNAIKFRREEAAPAVEVAVEATSLEWTMRVSDNGIGIEERFVPKMFDMFARFHPVGRHEGAGVGLALSKRIVDCHGGQLTARPNAGRPGTQIMVQIPVLSKDRKAELETGRFPY